MTESKVMLTSSVLVFMMGLPILSHQPVVLKIGVISGLCRRDNTSASRNTTLSYHNRSLNDLSAEIYWRFVNISEDYQVFRAVIELNALDLDCIVIAADIKTIDAVRNIARLPVIDWGKDRPSNQTSRVTTPDGCQMTSTVEPTVAGRCVRPPGNFVYKEPLFQNVTGVSLTLLAVISQLKWSSVNIVYDDDTAHEAAKLHHRLSAIGMFAVMHHMKNMTSQKIDTLMHLKSKAHDETSLNSTILCKLDTCMQYLEKPFDYHRKHVLRSSLLHNSRWLLGIFHDGDISILENNSTELDNVAIIQYPTSLIKVPFENDVKLEEAVKTIFADIENNNITDRESIANEVTDRLYDFDTGEIEECTWIPIKTLMWIKGRARGLSTVGYTQLTGGLLTQNRIFPNAVMGFNKRKFKASTLPWEPFVVFDNKTQNYTGFTIDLLLELAHGLNFTYEMSQPGDNQWGIEQENDTWTGLIGQLQRREIDLVAAPLTMQTDRERVMDLSHPYFYEATVILLKKPDPNDSKWRTLIDPFHPYVLICIFISLPVSSFFLFFFEKNNPYYRNVEGRNKVRGLHHFSDSFWYMYGALLTQGGEHMADSLSGRTLLSFWWIFSIIMMATYSGNLIAFLTVEKDKLPINNLADLVSQDKYRWGTQGGTAFETIFKKSELPEYRMFWSKLVEFNQTDHTVLSGDGNKQIEKVKKGDYAYVGDRTFMELKTMNNCELGIAASDILPLQYSIGLPNNSPYTKLFSDEIIAIHESGLLQIWKMNHWPKPGFCKGSLLKEAKAITLIDIHSSFYMIAIGIFIALVSLFGEFMKHKYCKWREEQGKAKPRRASITHISTNPRLDEFISY